MTEARPAMSETGNRWRAFAYTLNLTRFNVLILFAGAGLLILPD